VEQSVLSSFSCPRCGGDNALAAGERFLVCSFCDNTLYLDRSGVVGHFRLPRLLDADKARSALNRWMTGNQTVKDLDRKSSVVEMTAMTFPMWLFRSRRAGSEEVFVEPAAPTPIPQLADLKVPAGELEPFQGSEDGAEQVMTTISLETARGWLTERGVDSVSESSLVEIPLWRVRYRYDGKEYQALVDGSTGSVLATVYPEKSESPFVLVAVLGLLLFGIEGLVITNLAFKFVAYAVTALPLVLIAYWVTRKV
jgi:hypothetical protein